LTTVSLHCIASPEVTPSPGPAGRPLPERERRTRRAASRSPERTSFSPLGRPSLPLWERVGVRACLVRAILCPNDRKSGGPWGPPLLAFALRVTRRDLGALLESLWTRSGRWHRRRRGRSPRS